LLKNNRRFVNQIRGLEYSVYSSLKFCLVLLAALQSVKLLTLTLKSHEKIESVFNISHSSLVGAELLPITRPNSQRTAH
jgi:hypothetical protein